MAPARPPAGQATAAERWPWLPFVDLSLIMALGPGFLMGAVMIALGRTGELGAGWYAAARQAHGHAQLLGWGGAMILGVGLHFLPRIRGAKPRTPHLVPLLFWLYASGLALRVAVPLAAALTAANPGLFSSQLLRAALVGGAWLELLAAAGLMALLVATLRQGPPLAQKKAFAEMLPLLAVAGASMGIALGFWTAGAQAAVATDAGVPVIAPWYDRAAVDAAAFGFIPAVSVAMSARLFPLFFRLPLSHPRLLRAAAVALGTAVVLDAAQTVVPRLRPLQGLAFLLQAAGLAVAVVAVRVFARRQAFPGDRGRYSPWRDPAAVGITSAYLWACAAALSRLGQGLAALEVASLPGLPAHDAALHAIGAGFMTLLILGVGHVLLPGFGGGKPGPQGLAWASVVFGNLAALLRLLPAAAAGSGLPLPPGGAALLFAGAGLSGMAAVAALGLSLWLAWRTRPPAGQPQG